MADLTLKTNFVNGDEFTPGTTASTDAVNGINTQINTNTTTKLGYVGSDLTEGTIHTSVTETTIASVTIPANTIITGALYIASLKGRAQVGAANGSTYRIKSGVAASEVTRQTLTIYNGANEGSGGCIVWYDTAPTWTNDVSVIITGQNDNNNAGSKTIVNSLVVIGF